MKSYIITAVVMISMISSQANTVQKDLKITGIPATTAIKNELHPASVHKIPRYKIIRSNPYKISHRLLDDDVDDFIDDDSLITSYRRKDLNKLEPVEELSDYVRFRLFLARQLALLKYQKLYG